MPSHPVETEMGQESSHMRVTPELTQNATILAALETIRVHRFIPYRRTFNIGSESSGAALNLDDRPVPSGLYLILTHAMVVDDDNSPTTMRIGVMIGQTFYELTGTSSPTAGIPVEFASQHILTEGEFVRFRILNPTSGDNIRALISGFTIRA